MSILAENGLELQISERDSRLIEEGVGKVFERLIRALNQTQPTQTLGQTFALQSLPSVSPQDFLRRFTLLGEISAPMLLGALMLTDRALKTGLFLSSLCLHQLFAANLFIITKIHSEHGSYTPKDFGALAGILPTTLQTLELALLSQDVNIRLSITQDEYSQYKDRVLSLAD